MTTANEEQKPVRGDRVRIPDGREGKLLWIIPSGKEAAVELDGEAGSFHLPPDQLTILPWFEGKLARGAIEVPEDDNGLVSATIPTIIEVLGGEPGKYAGKTLRILVDLHNGEIRFDDFTKELLNLPTQDEEAGECADCDALGCGPHTVHELEQRTQDPYVLGAEAQRAVAQLLGPEPSQGVRLDRSRLITEDEGYVQTAAYMLAGSPGNCGAHMVRKLLHIIRAHHPKPGHTVSPVEAVLIRLKHGDLHRAPVKEVVSELRAALAAEKIEP